MPDADVERAQCADDDASLLGAEAERARRAAARRRPVLAVGEEAHLDGLVDALRHDAAAEPGDPPDLGPRRRFARPYEVDDAQEARHLIGLSPESQCGLPCHALILTQRTASAVDFGATMDSSTVLFCIVMTKVSQ